MTIFIYCSEETNFIYICTCNSAPSVYKNAVYWLLDIFLCFFITIKFICASPDFISRLESFYYIFFCICCYISPLLFYNPMDLQTAYPIEQNPKSKITIKNKFTAIATVLSTYLFFFTIFVILS